MLEKDVLLYRDKNNRNRCDIEAIQSWDGFEQIILYLEKFFHVTVESKFDGPDARRWILKTPDGIVELQHDDPWGNSLISMSTSTDKFVEKFSEEIKKQIIANNPSS